MESSVDHAAFYAGTNMRRLKFIKNPAERKFTKPDGPHVDEDIKKLLREPHVTKKGVKNSQVYYAIQLLGRMLVYCYSLLGYLTNRSVDTIKKAYLEHVAVLNGKKVIEETTLGRNRKHSQEMAKQLKEHMNKHKNDWLKLSDIAEYLYLHFGVNSCDETLRKWLKQHGIIPVKAEKMERHRLNFPPATIYDHFEKLKAKLDGKSPSLVLNADEVGYSYYADAQTDFGYVCKNWGIKCVKYPVDRDGHKATGCVTITADGTLLKPYFLVKRKTVDEALAIAGFYDDFFLGQTDSAFINELAFNEWIEMVILPYVTKKRREIGREDEVAVLILDGCTSHKLSPEMERKCDGVLELFKLPAHSSHLLQPLDLGIFGTQKRSLNANQWAKKLGLEKMDEQTAHLIDIYTSLQRSTIKASVKSAFRAAGITSRFSFEDQIGEVEVNMSCASSALRHIKEKGDENTREHVLMNEENTDGLIFISEREDDEDDEDDSDDDDDESSDSDDDQEDEQTFDVEHGLENIIDENEQDDEQTFGVEHGLENKDQEDEQTFGVEHGLENIIDEINENNNDVEERYDSETETDEEVMTTTAHICGNRSQEDCYCIEDDIIPSSTTKKRPRTNKGSSGEQSRTSTRTKKSSPETREGARNARTGKKPPPAKRRRIKDLNKKKK